MSGSHEKLPGFFWVQLVAAAIVGILWLFAPSEDGHGDAEAKVDPTMANALKPIGTVALAKPAIEAGAPRSGDAIVEKNCKVCHAIGLANAPKLDESAKADWEARLAGGFDAVVASAIKGKGGMPPRGGDPSLSDDEIASAIKHMMSTVGVEVAEASEAKEAPKTEVAKAVEAAPVEEAVVDTAKVEPASQKEAKVEPAEVVAATKEPSAAIVATALGESTYKSSCFACHDSGVANSPKFGDKAVWAPRIATGISSLHTAAIKGKGAMPGKGGNPSLSDQAVMEAVNYMVVNSQ
ncbi:MAG: c-type cytochrome [Leucothrix sp.]